MMAATFVPIQSVTLGSSAASVTFSNIPQTYTDIVALVTVRDSDTGSWGVGWWNTVNGDSTTKYSETEIYGQSSTAYSQRYANATGWGDVITASGATANTFTTAEIYFPNYTATTSRQFSTFVVAENNSSTNWRLQAEAGLYRGTSAITSMTFVASSTFVAGCTFHLYGIKNS